MVGVETVAWRAINGNITHAQVWPQMPGTTRRVDHREITVTYGHAEHTPAGLGVSRLRTTQSDECVFPRVTITSADAIHVSR